MLNIFQCLFVGNTVSHVQYGCPLIKKSILMKFMLSDGAFYVPLEKKSNNKVSKKKKKKMKKKKRREKEIEQIV